MNFDLSDEQELFRATVKRFGGGMDAAATRQLRSCDGGYDRSRWGELADLGLIALGVAEAQGGLGGSAIDLAMVGEAFGHSVAPDPWLENGFLPARLLSLAGADSLLAEVLSGEQVVALAIAERQARYSLVPRQTKVRISGGRHFLHGEKTFVLGGALADVFIVSADLAGEPAFYLVPADRAGVDRRNYRVVDGSLACELRFSDVELSAHERLGIEQNALVRTVADARLLSAAEMLGLAQRLFDDTLDYVRQREQFGVAIGTFQAIQHRLVDCYALLEQSRSMLYRAALGEPGDALAWRRSSAGAKAAIGDWAGHIAREAVQLHGGMGITEELTIGRALKRILLLTALFGDSDATLVDYAVAA